MTIAFYTTKDQYGCFSNFYRAPIKIDGVVWPTTEHFYQAQKATHPELQQAIRFAETPKIAAKMGRGIAPDFFRKDWEEIKYKVMLYACEAKFRQHPNLKQILLSTGDQEIVEWTEGTPLADSVWGNAKDKDGNPGKNLLGKVLMELRTKFREEETSLEGI